MSNYNVQVEKIEKLLERKDLTNTDINFINKVLAFLKSKSSVDIKKTEIQNIIFYISNAKLGINKKYWEESFCTKDSESDSYIPNSDLIIRMIPLMENSKVLNELSELCVSDREVKRCNSVLDYYEIVLNILKDLYEKMNILSSYNTQNGHYLDLKEENARFKDENRRLIRKLKHIQESFLSRIKNRKQIKYLKSRIADNDSLIDDNANILNKLYIYIQNLLTTLNNPNLLAAFYLNLRVSHECKRLEITDNPFTNQELDITFDWALNSHRINDFNYFLGCNLQSINKDNLMSAIKLLQSKIRDNQRVLQLRILAHGNLIDNLSKEAHSITETDYETALSFGELHDKGMQSDITVSIWLEVLDILGQIEKDIVISKVTNVKNEKKPVLQIKPIIE